MPRIEIYTRDRCPYCEMAKRLLRSKGQDFEEVNLSREPERTQEMVERAGGRQTVPEIFVDGRLVGGYDDLAALESRGELDRLLQAGAD